MTEQDRTPWQGWRRKDEDAGLPAAKGPGSRRSFGATWWGRAWLDALEHRARLDPGRLSRGRSYARRGSVLELTVSPGEVEAIHQIAECGSPIALSGARSAEQRQIVGHFHPVADLVRNSEALLAVRARFVIAAHVIVEKTCDE